MLWKVKGSTIFTEENKQTYKDWIDHHLKKLLDSITRIDIICRLQRMSTNIYIEETELNLKSSQYKQKR